MELPELSITSAALDRELPDQSLPGRIILEPMWSRSWRSTSCEPADRATPTASPGESRLRPRGGRPARDLRLRRRRHWRPSARFAKKEDGNRRFSEDPRRYAARHDVPQQAVATGRQRDDIRAEGFGLEENLTRWITEPHNAFERDVLEEHRDRVQVGQPLRFQSRHFLIGVRNDTSRIAHDVGRD